MVEVNSVEKQRCRMMGTSKTSKIIKQGKKIFISGICSLGIKYKEAEVYMCSESYNIIEITKTYWGAEATTEGSLIFLH